MKQVEEYLKYKLKLDINKVTYITPQLEDIQKRDVDFASIKGSNYFYRPADIGGLYQIFNLYYNMFIIKANKTIPENYIVTRVFKQDLHSVILKYLPFIFIKDARQYFNISTNSFDYNRHNVLTVVSPEKMINNFIDTLKDDIYMIVYISPSKLQEFKKQLDETTL